MAVQVDHTGRSQVKVLFDRVKREQGRLDILVNDIWGGEELVEWGKPFWALSLEKELALMERAIHTHIITSRYGVPLMVERNAGLITADNLNGGRFSIKQLYQSSMAVTKPRRHREPLSWHATGTSIWTLREKQKRNVWRGS